jgi:hypothetical protein
MGNCGACGVACAAGRMCEAGVCSSPTSDWPMFGYDPEHRGENPLETGSPPLTLQWSMKMGLTAAPLSPAAVEAGRVFVIPQLYMPSSYPMWAVALSDGSALWSYDFGGPENVGHPAAIGGTVYVAQNKGISSATTTRLWAFDASSGVPKWSAAFGSQWEKFWAPTISGGKIYIDGGVAGGLYAFDLAGNQIFFNSTVGQYDLWSAAVHGGFVYTFVGNTARAHDPVTGATLWSSVFSGTSPSASGTAPVLDGTTMFIVAPPSLQAVSVPSHAVIWSQTATYAGTPAVSSGVVYALSAGNLLARDAATGALLWFFPGDGQLSYPPIIAHGHVYVASDTHTYAVSIAAHTAAWSANEGGWLTLASGRLLVARKDGVLSAYKLSP